MQKQKNVFVKNLNNVEDGYNFLIDCPLNKEKRGS